MFKLHWFLMSFSQLSIILLTFSPALIYFFYWYGYYDNFVNALVVRNRMMFIGVILLIFITAPMFKAFNTKYCLEQYKTPDQSISFIKAIPSFKSSWKSVIYSVEPAFLFYIKYVFWYILFLIPCLGAFLYFFSNKISSDLFDDTLEVLLYSLICMVGYMWAYKNGLRKKIMIASIWQYAVHSNYMVDLNQSEQYAEELISGYENEFSRLRKHNIKISFIGFLCFGIGYIPAVAYSTLTEIIFFSKLEKLKFDNNKNQNHI